MTRSKLAVARPMAATAPTPEAIWTKLLSLESRLNQLLNNATDWQTLGSPGNGWGYSSGGFGKYRLDYSGNLVLVLKGLTPGTVPDGTVVYSVANGLAAGFRPAVNHLVPGFCDHSNGTSALGFQTAGVQLITDGSIVCFGISPNATRLDLNGVYAIDI